MPDKSVGWRLANPSVEGGSAVLDSLALGSSPHLRKTPIMRRKHRRPKMPSSPATLFAPSSALSEPIQEQRGKGQMSLAHVKVEGSGNWVVDSDSPKVIVVDLQSRDVVSFECRKNDSGNRIKETTDDKRVDDCESDFPHETEKDNVREVPMHTRNNESTRAGINKKLPPSKPAEEEGGSGDTSTGVECQSLEHSVSQKSLSSFLSQVSVGSTKSVFSLECDYEMDVITGMTTEDGNDVTVQNDNTLTDASTPTMVEKMFLDHSSTASGDTVGGVPVCDDCYDT